MKPRKPPPEQDDLLRARLVEMIDMRHELVKLAALIDWEVFEREWAGFFPSPVGRPATPTRLVAGLFYLQHAFRLSDEAVVRGGQRTLTGSISVARRSSGKQSPGLFSDPPHSSTACRSTPRR